MLEWLNGPATDEASTPGVTVMVTVATVLVMVVLKVLQASEAAAGEEEVAMAVEATPASRDSLLMSCILSSVGSGFCLV